ncbi:GNAT family N-acetyltransferase [Mycetocola miduiensis]|uniref:Ribosomal protein S18 acetylase RimI n=1 Tax=Mycetocola miduiensis TaxID=995034 RepID=A0A1I5DFC0_9MICO|nr:GNAT family N-acetyltransferase [Mycetocola miduiensis]SFN97817.1 Ribosomal protein S18 acetylase RimI [Mycetocola miduiensis]
MTAVTIISPTESDWERVRDLRLEMLRDTPIAFMETIEAAEANSEEVWRMRANRGTTAGSVQYVAVDASGRWVGTMSGFLDKLEVGGPLLVGAFVAPTARGRVAGVADALLDAVEEWARTQGDTLTLHVHEDNDRAIAFYRRRGYDLTGRTIPYNLDPSRNELEMHRTIV